MLRRINERIGANITIHDLRHTLCLRLVNDPNVSLVDAQQVMRHRHITTTSGYVRPRVDEVIAKMQEHYHRPAAPPVQADGWHYDQSDLDAVSGGALMPRYGKVPRTPISQRRPELLQVPDPFASPSPAPNEYDHATVPHVGGAGHRPIR